MRDRLVSVVCTLGAVLWLAGCDNGSPTSPDSGDGTLVLAINGLEPLAAGYVYEGWIIVGGTPISSGRFGVAGDGTPERSSFSRDPDQLAAASSFVLTIEPEPDPDPAPSASKYLAGDFGLGAASLSVAHPAALGSDFASATGSYILETPTTAAIPGDYAQGIWWLDPAAGPGASLSLPELPQGWVYEGWVVVGGSPITTGRFAQPAGADSDGAGAGAGPDGSPPFPGQDFIMPARQLSGGMAVISIEPEPDDSDAPFTLKPLVDSNVADVGPGVLQEMSNNSASFPTGTAMR